MAKIGQTGETRKVKIWDGTDEANVDSKRSGLATITTPHDAVHDGIMFIASHIFADVGAGANADFLISVGANRELHIIFFIVSGGEADVYLYEGTTVTAYGTQVTIYDMNRVTANTSDATAYHTPTVTAVGTNMDQTLIEGGTVGRTIGGQLRTGTEWILRKNTNYLVRATNNTAQAQNMATQAEFYEV